MPLTPFQSETLRLLAQNRSPESFVALKEAMWRVKANKGSAGIDGVTVDELPDYRDLLAIREQLLSGTYKPQPVKRVEIPKPDGGVSKLGIPTTLDRFDQQAATPDLQAQ